MKYTLIVLLFIATATGTAAQDKLPVNLLQAYQQAKNDSLRFEACYAIYAFYGEGNRDSALYYCDQMVILAKKNNKPLVKAGALALKAYALTWLGRYVDALPCLNEAFEIAGNPANESNGWNPGDLTPKENRLIVLSLTHHMHAILIGITQKSELSIAPFLEARKIAAEVKKKEGTDRVLLADMNLGNIYLDLGRLDSAWIYETEAKKLALEINSTFYLGAILKTLGNIALEQGNKKEAKELFYQALGIANEQNNVTNQAYISKNIAKFYLDEKEKDSSLMYAIKAFKKYQSLGQIGGEAIFYDYLYQSYRLNNRFDSAFKYASLALAAKDSLDKKNTASLADFKQLTFNEQLRVQKIEKEKAEYQNKVRTYFLLSGIAVLLLIAIIFYRNNLQKQKAKLKIEKAYDDLKVTQRQLIQSEKMASLGELTAGIAHEIQNPLNFVNNFSEVSTELVDEMNTEIDKGNLSDAKDIANDLKQNLEKINHHGKRAGDIVKGMLQHSRSSSGVKEPTDINALCDEYLRLSYHGLRAKDKSFNATMKTDFDDAIGNINIIPQDIGRVILNLLTNAFYVVDEKKKASTLRQAHGSAGHSFEPTVSITTKKVGDNVSISVSDNGNGIPQKVLDKIFQPFFTTKPTGQGTGLGLSLSYDIVTKGHHGQLKVETKEGHGTTFIIILPY